MQLLLSSSCCEGLLDLGAAFGEMCPAFKMERNDNGLPKCLREARPFSRCKRVVGWTKHIEGGSAEMEQSIPKMVPPGNLLQLLEEDGIP